MSDSTNLSSIAVTSEGITSVTSAAATSVLDQFVFGGTDHQPKDGSVQSVSGSTKQEIVDGQTDPSVQQSTDQTSFTKSESEDEERGTWRGDYDFLIASVGTLVGLGNIWKFPILVFKNGGGAFLVSYFLCVLIGGIPLIFMEVAIGQFMSKEGPQAWNLVPLFQGIAVAQFVVMFYLCCYYNVVIAWAFYYMLHSFAAELPWENCHNEWNTPNCSENFHDWVQVSVEHHTHSHNNSGGEEERHLVTPVEEYWEYELLGLSDGIDAIGEIKWDLAFCLLFSWFIVYCCVCKGILITGRIMHVTTSIPYLIMLVLLVQHSLMPGAVDGLKYYISPDFSKLTDYHVWKDAGEQVFMSSSIGFGILTVLGSYNKFNHNSLRDSMLIACFDAVTSFLFGLIVFTILGFMAHEEGRDIEEVSVGGPGLAFVAYPTAVTEMPAAPLWSVLFFLMVIITGVDSQFVVVEALVNGFLDQYPHLLHIHKRDFFTSIACGFFCVVGLLMVTKGGMYVFLLFDHYSSGSVVILIGLCELVAISHVYGIRRFCDNIMMMLGNPKMKYTLPYLVVCWTVLTPIFCLTMLVLSFADYSELVYERSARPVYHFPAWTKPIGWCMAGSSAIWIPLVMIYKFFKHGANIKALKLQTVPYYLHPHQKRPQDENEECLYDLEPKVEVQNTEEDRKPSRLSVLFTRISTSL